MTLMKIIPTVLLAFLLAAPALPAMAQSLEAQMKQAAGAYERKDMATAVRIWKVWAAKGNAEAQTLLALIGLKQELRALGIGKLEQGPDALVFAFAENAPVDPQKIVALVQNKPAGKKPGKPIRLTPDRRLLVPVSTEDDLFSRIQTIVNALKG